ncbi:MAG: NrdJb [Gammaproteobacteria bacterium]|nr:NrdJb [Gammaproteobacteria bacterium]MDH5628563.1 NrdJb [Gammaproteobacteria bacterium]
MPKIIDKPIVGYKVKTEDAEAIQQEEQHSADIVHMHESVKRPEMLLGSTYKVKTPLSDHALYVTINDIILNQGTEHELRRPFEVFINSKNMDHFQWVVALTRVISAVFRKGGDCTFLTEELKAVFDPKGGYFKAGGKFMPSLVAEIGDAIESHLKMIGLIKEKKLDSHQQKMVDEKKAEIENQKNDVQADYPDEAQMCSKCMTKAAVLMDGCMTCLSCGDSKCG